MENYHAICDWYSGICVWDSDYGSNYVEKDLRDLMDSKQYMTAVCHHRRVCCLWRTYTRTEEQ